ncbi:DNA repair protein RecN [Thiorhodococcus mannitoliphagus]|uniref:DNA repair protein RecN n=1 Tax=Thiorhodococcus mannitoliphagus TaxID=329406 RepID=A0A6P1E0D6_9GAMM|nr:DNA repair protein RecN [Thiorhodococcus mannitoliphagus]NEX22506.1 DNA repair protein RecN [Thiorhodococcus mannitoliphagus]
MLTHLQVRDLAIVSHLELDCRQGMTALTGETGAGKSILIDALGLVLGDKAQASMIRVGSERAEILCEVDLGAAPMARAWLAEQGLDDEDLCIIRRLIVREGRSRAFINGRTVSGAQLRDLGDRLIDIHGQHEHQSLMRASAQRDLLDAYGGHVAKTTATAGTFRAYRDLDQRLTELETASQDRADRLELLRFQVEELSALGMSAEDIEQLDHEQRRLSHLDRLQATTGGILQALSEGEPSIADQLRIATNDVAEMAAIDPELSESRDLLETATIHAGEAAAGLRHYLDGLDLDPAALREVETRLAQVHDLARKHRVFPVQLPELLAERQAELERLEQAGVTLGDLRQRRTAAWQAFMEQAQALTAERSAAAERLSKTVTEAMQQLGMTGGRFSIELEALAEARIGASGLERVEFLVSANPGQPLQPLAKVASGGELSRISLAIQVATAECGSVPTLVFDEVDVGIGGGVAEIVGRLLRGLGESRQVLCVTHLPQVAAQAHHQLRVRKEAVEGQTHTRIEPLDDQARVDEIARMLGGTEITARTRDHASEMLGWVSG